MRSLLRRVRASRSRSGSDRTLLLTARVSAEAIRAPRGIAAIYDASIAGPLLHWGPPTHRAEDAFVAAGRGEARRIFAGGSDALAAIRKAGTQLLGDIVEERADGCEAAPPPRLYGGTRFVPASVSENQDDPWQAFPDAGFVLPRWLLLQRGKEHYLQLAVSAAELDDPGAIDLELTAIEQALFDEAFSSETKPAKNLSRLSELSAEHYVALVETALAGITAGELIKVVTARRSLLEAERPFVPPLVLQALARSYPECQRFAFECAGAVFLGATPELLASRRGRVVTTEALAGTRPRSEAGGEAEAPEALFRDDKERREHAHVIAAIIDALENLCSEAPAQGATGLRSLRNVHHLCTPIRGTLTADVHILDLLAKLHPTPAVCGLPQDRARRFIAQNEPVSRGMYAAPVGWFDGGGDGTFCVAIRSALLHGNRAWLYAGAGIVAGSDPQREYRETAAKQRAMLDALEAWA